MNSVRLGRNIDHVATLRNARGAFIPIRYEPLWQVSKPVPTALLCI